MAERNDRRSRRDFLITLAAGTAGGALVSTDAVPAARQSEFGFLIDTTRCKYCLECIRDCEDIHQDTPGTFYINVSRSYPRGKDGGAVAVPTLCLHCIDPPCVTVCQSGALEKTALGPVILDDDKCIGCLSCLSVCPFDDCLHYQSTPVRFFKCDMCYDRISEGVPPACVEACEKANYDALFCGPFSEILEQGRELAEEVGGVLLYPEDTNSLIVFKEEDYNEPLMAKQFGFSRRFSLQARAKATITRIAHLGWLPIIGGLFLHLRKNRTERPAGPEQEEG